jgi:hypothetical protein
LGSLASLGTIIPDPVWTPTEKACDFLGINTLVAKMLADQEYRVPVPLRRMLCRLRSTIVRIVIAAGPRQASPPARHHPCQLSHLSHAMMTAPAKAAAIRISHAIPRTSSPPPHAIPLKLRYGIVKVKRRSRGAAPKRKGPPKGGRRPSCMGRTNSRQASIAYRTHNRIRKCSGALPDTEKRPPEKDGPRFSWELDNR